MMLAALVGVLAFLRRKIEWGTGWMFPVPSYKAPDGRVYRAVISDGVGSPRGTDVHRGVDILYRRIGDRDRPEFRAGTTDGTKGFFAPPLVPIVAAKDGRIRSAERAPTGWTVVIDHGKPFATYYTHMAALALAPRNTRSTAPPVFVKAGDVIGVMGFDPRDPAKLRHLHFSVAYEGPPESAAVDPEPAMRTWARPSRLFEG